MSDDVDYSAVAPKQIMAATVRHPPETPSDGGPSQFPVRVGFGCLQITTGVVGSRSVYVASDGGDVVIQLEKGDLKGFTEAETVSIESSTTETSRRTESEKGADAAEGGMKGVVKGKSSHASEKQEGTEVSTTRKHTTQEAQLAAVELGDGRVHWQVRSARGSKEYADFMMGNVDLEFEAEFVEGTVAGKAFCTPSKVTFYDDERREVAGTWRRLGMRALLVWNRLPMPAGRSVEPFEYRVEDGGEETA